jgi:hypothetical protein
MVLGNWSEVEGFVVGGFCVAAPSVFPRLQNLSYLPIWGLGKTVQYEQENNRSCDDQSKGYPLRNSSVLYSGTVYLNQGVYICLDSM